MTQEKMRKIIAACISAATVLFFLLFAYLVYQWVTLSVLNKRLEKAGDAMSYWEVQVKKSEDAAAYYESEFFLQWEYQRILALQGENK